MQNGPYVSWNPWGAVMVHNSDETQQIKTIIIRFSGPQTLTLSYREEAHFDGKEIPFPEVLSPLSKTIIFDYIIETRRITKLGFQGIHIEWCPVNRSIISYKQASSKTKKHITRCHTLTAMVDDLLRKLTRYCNSSCHSWIHDILLEMPVQTKEFQWLGLAPHGPCITMREWLQFVRDVSLIPDSLPVVQQRILPGKFGLISLFKQSVDKRNTLSSYTTLKRFLLNAKENREHQLLYREFIGAITSSSFATRQLDLDTLWVNEQNQTLQTLKEQYNELKRV